MSRRRLGHHFVVYGGKLFPVVSLQLAGCAACVLVVLGLDHAPEEAVNVVAV